MILVTGASGQLGKAVVENLLTKTDAPNLAVLVRDAAKVEDLKARGVEIRVGDYDNVESLEKAFTGVDKLYFVSGSDVSNRSAQHMNVVNAAAKEGVGHIFYTSFQRANESGTSPIAFVAQSHLDTEKAIKASGLTYTILKHGLYTEVLPMFLGNSPAETGVFLPAGDGVTAFASREDMAAAGAAVLLGSGHENKEYVITGNRNYSMNDVAEALSLIFKKDVPYIDADLNTFNEALKAAGVPEIYINLTAGFSLAIAQGEFTQVDNTLKNLIGREPLTVLDVLEKIYA